MKALPTIALVLALAAIGTTVYGFVETKPNVKGAEARLVEGGGQGNIGRLDRAVLEEYRDAMKMEAYVSLGLGILAVGLGGFGVMKKEKVALSGAGAGLGAVAIALAIALGS